jgi:DNA modification methylase
MTRKSKPATEARTTLFNQKTNTLYRGDCLSILDRIERESVDLVYIDPPFFSNQYYELIWKDRGDQFAFEDRWKGGIQHYVDWMMERITRLFDVLKPTGSIVVHLDWHAVHYIKVEMDRLPVGKFRNEIIWHYTNKLGTGGNVLDRQHDTLLWYTKSKGSDYTFNPLYEPVKLAKPQPVTQKIGGERIWLRDEMGNRIYKESEKKRIGDVWDIPIINPMSKERLGYPTQKPLALLERVVESFTNIGDLVLDAFCGCGTTLLAAQRLGRQWIGIDISQTAINVVQNRLRSSVGTIEVHGLVKDIEDLEALSWQEFQIWAVASLFGRHSPRQISDMGIDGFSFLENNPIQVKQSHRVGRPVIDSFLGVLQREKSKRGIIVALSFSKGAYEEVARAKREDGVSIELITAQEILDGKVAVSQMH